MEIVVNDTNIFIDLYSVGLIDDFFSLPIEVHTVDFIVNEIENEQQLMLINQFVNDGRLKVHSLTGRELAEVVELQSNAGGKCLNPRLCSVALCKTKQLCPVDG